MPVLLSCQKVSKSYRSRPLFSNLTLSIEDGERLGIVGPNGAGKSTLLKIIAGIVESDAGKISSRKDLRISYLPQEDQFNQNSVKEVLQAACRLLDLPEHEENNRVEKQISQFAFPNPAEPVSSLSGGWLKRLAIARELIKEPDLLLLDEPTNHLDLDGVLWLEKLLLSLRISLMTVTHDRQFLENLSTRIVEINPVYEDGCLSVQGSYSTFLAGKEEYMRAQTNLEQSLASKVRREIAWLQRGARARQTKSSQRIREAGELIGNLEEVKSRNNQQTKIEIDFLASGRKSKELLSAKAISKSIGGKSLFSGLDILLHPGSRIGIIGANGSGKSTLLKVLCGELKVDGGSIKRAEGLRIVYFDQNRQQLDQSKTLWKSLCPDGDSVSFRNRSIHVSTWARRFLFKPDQLQLPISYLSGGEQARILIANLMKQEADLLVLDEPTNNLDLPSLEVLEESLLDFPGAVLLVSHDRFMIHEVPTLILALDGKGGTKYFADYEQWEETKDALEPEKASKDRNIKSLSAKERKGLSTSEKKELLEISDRIENAESALQNLQTRMEEPAVSSNHEKLIQMQEALETAQKEVESLYRRWEDLEARKAAEACSDN